MMPLSRFTVLDLTRVRSGPTCVRQLADWGALLGPGDSLRVRIAQIGQVFGPGAASITTLWF